MRNKWLIFLIILIVSGLMISYFKSEKEAQGRLLVRDAYYGDLLAVKEDVEDGAPLNYEFYFEDEDRQYRGRWFNALHAAASSGNEDIINFLLEQGIDINTQTPDGWTPLFIAARDGQAEAARLLVYRGADLNIQTNEGATALLMVLTQPFEQESQRMELLTYLLRRGANPNLPDKNGFTPLYYAAMLAKPQAVSLLLEYDANPDTSLIHQTLAYLETHPSAQAQKITALLKKRLVKIKK